MALGTPDEEYPKASAVNAHRHVCEHEQPEACWRRTVQHGESKKHRGSAEEHGAERSDQFPPLAGSLDDRVVKHVSPSPNYIIKMVFRFALIITY
jgi:hypothetical protein